MNLLSNKKIHRGFTLIELLVVISIIGFLSSVVLASLNTARVKARDAVRKSDLRSIQTALEMYKITCGTYVVKQNCSGTAYGANGGGYGWFNFPSYGGSAGSVGKGLVDNKVTPAEIIDPLGSITGSTAYMIYVDQNHYTLWATIENPTSADTATLNSCYFNAYDNYNGATPNTAVRNYCVSN